MGELIVKDVEILAKHTELNYDFGFDKLQPFIYRAENNWLPKLISKEQYITLRDYDGEDLVIKECIDHLESAISHFALMRGGIHIQNKMGNKGADEDNKREWWRDRDLIRSYRSTAMESLDMALAIMRERLDLFEDYRDSKAYKRIQNLVIKSPEDFSNFIDINDSMVTFMAIESIMRFVQISEFTTLDEDIFLNPGSEVQREALEKLKGIIAHRTKAQILLSNKFDYDGLGFSFKVELLPWEHKVNTDKEMLDKKLENELNKANVYREQLQKILNKNPSDFNIPTQEHKTITTKNESSLGLL